MATPIEEDVIRTLPPAAAGKARAEIAARPKVLPMNQRAYPYGHPDRKLVSDSVAETGCIGDLSQHGKGKDGNAK